MAIPQFYINTDEDQFSPNKWNRDNTYELVLQGEWSIDPGKVFVTDLDFTFHYKKRHSHLSSSVGPTKKPIELVKLI